MSLTWPCSTSTCPSSRGLYVLESLEQDGLATRVIFLTGTATDEQLAAGVERGAWGFLLKEHALDTLVQCLRTVAAGRGWVPGEVVAPAIRRATERREKDVQLARVLTAREYEIAGLVAQGLSNKHIARRLIISEGTVKIHLHNTFEKLGGVDRIWSVNRTSLAVLMRNSQEATVKDAA